jgi:glycosyltransferase involved in cell wall biosynthesis
VTAPPFNAVYVSYDGVLDPLGLSQVVSYVVGLARRGISLTLLSFEKADIRSAAVRKSDVAARLAEAGVIWRPLQYHRRPRVPATLWDMLNGGRVLREEVRRSRARLVHCRGDVAMALARWAGVRTPILYDVRGLFSDERVESESWRRDSLLDRVVRRQERANLERASGVVALTQRAMSELARRRPALPPHRIIPTCADLSAFTPRSGDEEPAFGLAYVGSLGTWYMTVEMVQFARRAATKIPGRVLFLTHHAEEARRAGVTPDWAEVRGVPSHEVPAWLRRARAVFFFIRPTPAKRASCPTKLAEALGVGLPVVANKDIGDMDALFAKENVGVLVDDFTDAAYDRAAETLARLAAAPETAARCRRVAEERFGLDGGVTAYHELYRAIGGPAQ